MNQPAFALAERGAALAADRANRMHAAWAAQALAAFRAYAATHDVFTTEDVIAASPEVPAAPEKRAWGHIALLAKREQVIVNHGFGRSKLTHAHGRIVNVWGSLVYQSQGIAA